MSLINNSFCKFIIVACRTEFKKCCFYIVFLQYFQNFWCCITVWAVIKSKIYYIFRSLFYTYTCNIRFFAVVSLYLNFSFFLCYYFSFFIYCRYAFICCFPFDIFSFCTVAELYIQMFARKHCKFWIYHSLFSYFYRICNRFIFTFHHNSSFSMLNSMYNTIF